MRAKYILPITFFVLALSVLSSCRAPTSTTPTPTEPAPKLSQQSPDIRGVIQEIYTPGGSVSGLFVEGKKETDTTYDRAQVGIDEKTKIFKEQEDKYVNATISDLQLGQTVEILFTGPILTSDPVQASALEIVITK